MQMNKGQIISGAGHLALIGWAFLGGFFTPRHEVTEVAQVTTVSEQQYAEIMRQFEAPDATDAAARPKAPEPDATTSETVSTPDAPPQSVRPPERPEPEPKDAQTAEPEPLPERPAAALIDNSPEITPPTEEVAMAPPLPATRPKPRPARRVAPEPVAPPEPDVKPDDVAQTPTEPAQKPAEVVEKEREETAPEEAATEIVTEAEKTPDAPPQTAPSASMRPKTRPKQLAEAETPAAAEKPAETARSETAAAEKPATKPAAKDTDKSAVDAALAEALGQSTAPQTSETPAGPPLTAGEKDALRVEVQRCWNVGSLSSDALAITVTVKVDMTEAATPVTGSIRMIDYSGGSEASAKQAFEAARRAIIRCGSKGFNLPRDKYGQWREIEMTFNPEKMRIK